MALLSRQWSPPLTLVLKLNSLRTVNNGLVPGPRNFLPDRWISLESNSALKPTEKSGKIHGRFITNTLYR